MRFITSKSALLSALNLQSKVVTTSTVVPILENFLFAVAGSTLTIVATDLQTTIQTQLSVEGKEDGKVAVPSRILLEALKSLAEQPISFSVNAQNYAIEITAGDGNYKFAGLNAEDFPKVPEVTEPSTLSISANVLSVAIGKTLFAVSTDELRPAMTGVYCNITTSDITFVATDTHKLVRYRRSDAHGQTHASFIVLKKALSVLKDALPDTEVNVELQYNKSNASFKFGNVEVYCRLIDEKYPNYEAILPNDNGNILTISRLELLGSLKRVAIFANQTTHQIRFTISPGRVELAAEDMDYESEAKELLFADYKGEDIVIGFSAKLVTDLLKNLDNEEVQLLMSEPNRPALIVPNDPEAHEDITMLIMPMMLNSK